MSIKKTKLNMDELLKRLINLKMQIYGLLTAAQLFTLCQSRIVELLLLTHEEIIVVMENGAHEQTNTIGTVNDVAIDIQGQIKISKESMGNLK
jgi:hypothetical protein